MRRLSANGGGGTRSWRRRARERARESLFLVPTALALAGIALAVATLLVDENLSGDLTLPLSVASTADSARSVLSTVASATMTFAGIAFSVTLLVFQMSSSQYSPRVIHGLFRDGFNKRIIGLVVGTFTYCLVVLRSVHGPVEGGPDAAVPTFSASVAVLLGVVTVLAIVGFIDHNAHRMDISRILADITEATRTAARSTWWPEALAVAVDDGTASPPSSARSAVLADQGGWVQQLDIEGLLAALSEPVTVTMATRPGLYVVEGSPLAHVSGADDRPVDVEDGLERPVRNAVVLGASRTVTQDPAYGLRQMVDVAVKALSPGINDPTTAQDALFHLADALRSTLLAEGPPERYRHRSGACVVVERRSRTDMVELTFLEVGRAAGPQPAVTAYLLAAISSIMSCADGIDEGPAVRAALLRQASLAVDASERAGNPPSDLDPLRSRLIELRRL